MEKQSNLHQIVKSLFLSDFQVPLFDSGIATAVALRFAEAGAVGRLQPWKFIFTELIAHVGHLVLNRSFGCNGDGNVNHLIVRFSSRDLNWHLDLDEVGLNNGLFEFLKLDVRHLTLEVLGDLVSFQLGCPLRFGSAWACGSAASASDLAEATTGLRVAGAVWWRRSRNSNSGTTRLGDHAGLTCGLEGVHGSLFFDHNSSRSGHFLCLHDCFSSEFGLGYGLPLGSQVS